MSEEWILVPNQPVFDAHDEFTEEVLMTIVANCNKRIADTNDETPLVLGHTIANAPETEQPSVVGFANNFRMSKIGNIEPRPCITADFKFYPEKWNQAKEYKRRSVELWTKDLFFDPISLLKSSTPQRNLGISPYKKVGPVEKYAREIPTYQDNITGNGVAMATEALVSEIVAKLEESDVFAYVRKMMKGEAAKAAQEQAGTPDVEDTPAEPSAPAPQDTEKVRMQKDQLQFEVEKFKKEAEDTKTQLNELHRKFRRTERERDLVRLQSLGYVLDIPEEVEMVQDMPQEQYAKHLERIQKRYQKAPIGAGLNVAQPSDFGGEREFTRAQMDEVVHLATSKGLDYAEALKQVKGKK